MLHQYSTRISQVNKHQASQQESVKSLAALSAVSTERKRISTERKRVSTERKRINTLRKRISTQSNHPESQTSF